MLSNSLEIRDGYGMRGPWVIRKRTPILGVITNEIKEDTAAADTVRSPIYCKRKKEKSGSISELIRDTRDEGIKGIRPRWK